MHNSREIPELYEVVDKEKIHVHDPSLSFFVCGGVEDVTKQSFLSFRDAFLKVLPDSGYKSAHILVAEKLKPHFPNGNYQDLLSFETDIASISKLVILFSESFGSAAELGTFSSNQMIADRLLIFVDDVNHADNSYVKLGPFRSLQRKYSDYHICVMPTKVLNTPVSNHIAKVDNIDVKEFKDMFSSAIERRLTQVERLGFRTTFDPHNIGHIIRMICGLVQFYGALQIEEIQLLLEQFGVNKDNIKRADDLTLCAQMVGWVKSIRSSSGEFIVPLIAKSATSFPFNKQANFSHIELAPLIRDHYKKTDNERFKLIATAAAELSTDE